MALVKVDSPALARRVARVMRTASKRSARQAAAWVLCSIGHRVTAVTSALLATLNDSAENVEVRGQAAEALGNRFVGRRPHTPGYDRVGRELLAFLDHPDAELRYWAAFALGMLRYRPALPTLQRLAAGDVRVVAGGLSRVSEEAADASSAIQRGRYPSAAR